jgi:hypothetical protein
MQLNGRGNGSQHDGDRSKLTRMPLVLSSALPSRRPTSMG